MVNSKYTFFYISLGLIFVLYVLKLCLSPLPTADTWWMLASGREIVNNYTIPKTDVFSYTAYGKPWINHEWLSSVIFYKLYQWGGWAFLYIFKIVFILAAYIISLYSSYKKSNSVFASVLAGLWMVAVSGGDMYFDIRAYIFTYLFLAISILLLNLEFENNKNTLLWLPLITLLWANTHGGFILIFVLLLIYNISFGTEYMLHIRGKNLSLTPHLKKGWAVLCFMFLSSLANPYGYHILLYPFSFHKDVFYRKHLIEWIAPDYFGRNIFLTITVVVVFILLVLFRKKMNLKDFLLYIAFTHLAMTTVRHSVLYSIACMPLVAVIIREIERMKPLERLLNVTQKYGTIPIAIIGLLYFLPQFYNIDYSNLNMEKTLFPKAGVLFIKMNPIPPPMYNPYEWGGYMIWHLYPNYKVFIDGRANTVYPESVYKESLISMRGDVGWEKILNKYKINFVICNKFLRDVNNHHLPDVLQKSPQWYLIFEDDVEMIFVKNTPKNYKLIERAKKNLLFLPVTPYLLNKKAIELIRKGELEKSEILLNKALKLNPNHIPSLFNMGYVQVKEGNYKKAEAIFLRIIKMYPKYPKAHFMLGNIYERMGLNHQAYKEYKEEIKVNPKFNPAYNALKRLFQPLP